MILNVFVNDKALIYPQVVNPWSNVFKFHLILQDWANEKSVFCRKVKKLLKYFCKYPYITEKSVKVNDFTKENFSGLF